MAATNGGVVKLILDNFGRNKEAVGLNEKAWSCIECVGDGG